MSAGRGLREFRPQGFGVQGFGGFGVGLEGEGFSCCFVSAGFRLFKGSAQPTASEASW